MAWYDSSAYLRQLQLTNFAESLESIPRHYVRRITFVATILEDEFGADDVVKPLSAEDQEMLSWQARTENLQNDTEVREDLTLLSGRLCPYKNISFTLSGKVTDRNSHQPSTEPHPLSAYRHVSFRCAVLTDHSTSDGQVQLLFSYDGLRDRDFLRWRSHDHPKLVLLEARPSYRVFSLVQWDIVDKFVPNSGGQAATTGPRMMNWRPFLNHLAVDCQGNSTEKVPSFHGVRRYAKRKSPWIAEVRPKGNRGPRDNKIWLGSFPTPAAAARAADAGNYYYNGLENRFNFLDSPSYLQQIPRDLNEKDMKDFVTKEAHRLAKIPPSDENLWLWPSNGSFTATSQVSAGVLNPGPEQTDVCREPSLPPVLSYPEENGEPVIFNEITWGGLSDASDSGLHHETESLTASQPGLDSSLQGAEPEWPYDSYFIDWLFK